MHDHIHVLHDTRCPSGLFHTCIKYINQMFFLVVRCFAWPCTPDVLPGRQMIFLTLLHDLPDVLPGHAHYTHQMFFLVARCSSWLCILHKPDVLPGCQTFFLAEIKPPDVLPGWAACITCTPDDFPG